MGKGVGELAAMCKQRGVPCIGLAGNIAESTKANELFTKTAALVPDLVSKEVALREAGKRTKPKGPRIVQVEPPPRFRWLRRWAWPCAALAIAAMLMALWWFWR